MGNEIWVDIKGYEGSYHISNLGRVKSLSKKRRNNHGVITRKEKIIKSYTSKNGYPSIKLFSFMEKKGFTIHRLIATAFLPNPYNKPEVNHINGIRSDNRIENLEWVTTKENSDHCHKYLNPRACRGEKHRSAKLTYAKVDELKRLYKTGKYSYKELGKMYGVSDRSVGGAITGQYWNNSN